MQILGDLFDSVYNIIKIVFELNSGYVSQVYCECIILKLALFCYPDPDATHTEVASHWADRPDDVWTAVARHKLFLQLFQLLSSDNSPNEPLSQPFVKQYDNLSPEREIYIKQFEVVINVFRVFIISNANVSNGNAIDSVILGANSSTVKVSWKDPSIP